MLKKLFEWAKNDEMGRLTMLFAVPISLVIGLLIIVFSALTGNTLMIKATFYAVGFVITLTAILDFFIQASIVRKKQEASAQE